MKCYKCRAEVPEEAKFCSTCGAEQGFSEELIAQAVDGEQEAITELYNRTYNNAYYTVKALIKDEDTILDIIQDSYVKAFKNLNQLKEANKFRAWLKRICHNHAVDYLRKTKPVMFSAMSTDDEKIVEFEDDRSENFPEEVIDQKETSRLIKEILNSLSDEQRVVVGMFYYEQLSVKEIAETLSLNENTVKSRLNYARKKVAEQVTKLEKEQGIRLHGLAPIPFLLWLFRCQDIQAAEIPRSEILLVLQKECVKNSGSSPSAAPKTTKAGTAAKTAMGIAGKGLKAKIIAGIAAAAVFGAGAAGISAFHKKDQPKEAVETVQEMKEEKNDIDSEWLGEYVAEVDGKSVTLSILLVEEDEFAYSFDNGEDDFVTQGIPAIQGANLQIGDRVFSFSKDSVTYSGNILDDVRHENVVFYKIEEKEADDRKNEEKDERNEKEANDNKIEEEKPESTEKEDTLAENISKFEGYYTSTDTSLGITIKVIDNTTAHILLKNISSNGANAFNQEKQAYLDGDSLIMDMETSAGDTITFTLENGRLIVAASKHYEAKANTYISGTYTPE